MTRRLIIVDDEATLRLLLTMLVERDGRFDVVAVAEDGQEALDLVEEHDPDLLLLDVGLPRLDGLQVLEQLTGRRRPATVVLTGFDDPLTHRSARELGAVSCLVKGRDFAKVTSVLADA